MRIIKLFIKLMNLNKIIRKHGIGYQMNLNMKQKGNKYNQYVKILLILILQISLKIILTLLKKLLRMNLNYKNKYILLLILNNNKIIITLLLYHYQAYIKIKILIPYY